MLDVKLIKKLFSALNDELKKKDIIGELCICGGTVMCLVFKARVATRDVDAIFEPTEAIREAAVKVSKKFGIAEDWLNDGVKGFIYSDPPKEKIMEFSNLRIYAPSAEYMLAMKAVSARFDSSDGDDIIFLIEYLGIKSAAEVFSLISQYYPQDTIPSKTKFLLEELMQ